MTATVETSPSAATVSNDQSPIDLLPSISASYYFGGKDPDTLFFTTMPFGMTALEQYAWFHEGGGLELADQVYARPQNMASR